MTVQHQSSSLLRFLSGQFGRTSGRSSHRNTHADTLACTQKTHLHMLSFMRVCALTDVDVPLLTSCTVSMHKQKSEMASMCQEALKAQCKRSHRFVLMLSCYTRKPILVLEGPYLPCFFLMCAPHTHHAAYLGSSLTVYVFV